MKKSRTVFILVLAFSVITACSSSPRPAAANQPPAPGSAGNAVRTRRPVSPVTITYRAGTMSYFNHALRGYLKNDLEYAEKEALKTLDYEPRCIEAKWLLANIYKDRGELGRMVQMFENLGIREARESLFAGEVVAQGSKGYVVEVQDTLIKLDYSGDDGIAANDSFVIYDEGSVLQHPITLEILYVEKRLVAEAEIRSIYGNYSTAEVVTSPAVPINRGMRVIPKSEYSESVKSSK